MDSYSIEQTNHSYEALIDELMTDYGQQILQLVMQYVHNSAVAEDLTQEIFVKCYQALPTFHFNSSVKTWLWRIAIIRILRMIRTMPQSFAKLLVLAAVTLYSCQSVYSILMVFGLLPLTGMPLPFVSYGLTSLLLNAFLIGLVLSVYRRK